MAKFNKLERNKIFKKVCEEGTSFKKVGDSECIFKLIDDPNCRFKKAGYTFKPVGEDGVFGDGERIFKKEGIFKKVGDSTCGFKKYENPDCKFIDYAGNNKDYLP